MRGETLKGDVTVTLSLVFILLFSFLASILEAASIQNVKNYRRAELDLALESVFAEYKRELWEEYHVLGIDGNYEGSTFSEDDILGRLDYYGGAAAENEIQGMELMTDDGGALFYGQAVAYMERQTGLYLLEDKIEEAKLWEKNEGEEEKIEAAEREQEETLEEKLSEAEKELPKEDNPIETVSNLKKSNLLQIVHPNPEKISNKSITLSRLPSQRELRKGRSDFQTTSVRNKKYPWDIKNRLLFVEYAKRHFSSGESEDEKALSCELEYLIAGKESDVENMEAVVRRLIVFRFPVNYLYLLSDPAKVAEAEAMAVTLSGIIALPAVEQLVKQGILLAWTYGECLAEMNVLLSGNEVPLVKTKESWMVSLSQLLTGNIRQGEQRTDIKGLSYRDYLTILLFLQDRETLTMRMIDLVELNMQNRLEQTYFRADSCVMRMEVNSVCPLRRGVEYQFYTYYGYLY